MNIVAIELYLIYNYIMFRYENNESFLVFRCVNAIRALRLSRGALDRSPRSAPRAADAAWISLKQYLHSRHGISIGRLCPPTTM